MILSPGAEAQGFFEGHGHPVAIFSAGFPDLWAGLCREPKVHRRAAGRTWPNCSAGSDTDLVLGTLRYGDPATMPTSLHPSPLPNPIAQPNCAGGLRGCTFGQTRAAGVLTTESQYIDPSKRALPPAPMCKREGSEMLACPVKEHASVCLRELSRAPEQSLRRCRSIQGYRVYRAGSYQSTHAAERR
jgi:hypothetical protein